jgi:hypothetical protein
VTPIHAGLSTSTESLPGRVDRGGEPTRVTEERRCDPTSNFAISDTSPFQFTPLKIEDQRCDPTSPPLSEDPSASPKIKGVTPIYTRSQFTPGPSARREDRRAFRLSRRDPTRSFHDSRALRCAFYFDGGVWGWIGIGCNSKSTIAKSFRWPRGDVQKRRISPSCICDTISCHSLGGTSRS